MISVNFAEEILHLKHNIFFSSTIWNHRFCKSWCFNFFVKMKLPFLTIQGGVICAGHFSLQSLLRVERVKFIVRMPWVQFVTLTYNIFGSVHLYSAPLYSFSRPQWFLLPTKSGKGLVAVFKACNICYDEFFHGCREHFYLQQTHFPPVS